MAISDGFHHFSLNQIRKNRPYSVLVKHLNRVACAFLAVSLLQTSLHQMNSCSAPSGNKRKPLAVARRRRRVESSSEKYLRANATYHAAAAPANLVTL